LQRAAQAGHESGERLHVATTRLLAAHVDDEMHPQTVLDHAPREAVFEVRASDAIQQLGIVSSSQALHDVEPHLRLLRSQPFVKHRPFLQHALREVPAEELGGSAVVEDEADRGVLRISPSAYEAPVANEALQLTEQRAESLRCPTPLGERLQ